MNHDHRHSKKVGWVVFDLDDTLYLERDYVYSGFRAVSKCLHDRFKLDYDEVSTILISDFENGLRGRNLNRVIERFDLPDEILGDLIKIYRTHRPKIGLLPGMEELLSDLSNMTGLALITDGDIDSQKSKVRALDIEGIFNRIIFTDEFGKDRWKPSDFAFEKLKQLEGIKDFEAVYIGDNPLKDFIPARKSCFLSIRIIHPGGLHSDEPDLKGFEPDYRASTVEELKRILEGILRNEGKAKEREYSCT